MSASSFGQFSGDVRSLLFAPFLALRSAVVVMSAIGTLIWIIGIAIWAAVFQVCACVDTLRW